MAPDKKTIMESIEVLLDSGVKQEGEEFSIDGKKSEIDGPFTYMVLLKGKVAESYSLFSSNFDGEIYTLLKAKEKKLKFLKNDYVAIKVNKIYGEIIDE